MMAGAVGAWLHRLTVRPDAPAIVVALLVALFAALFVASYSLAIGDSKPHDVPMGLVTTADPARDFPTDSVTPSLLSRAMVEATGATFEIRPFATADAAGSALHVQEVFAVLAPAQDGSARLLISSAADSSIARMIERSASAIGEELGLTITVEDVNPLGPNDPSGLVMFYVVVASTVLGFVGAAQTRTNAPDLTLIREIGWAAARAALVAGAVAATVGPVLRLVEFPFVPVWALLGAVDLSAGMIYNIFWVLVGTRWALLPTWALLVVIGNASAGRAVAPAIQPGFFEMMSRALPAGAAVRALRDVTYFNEAVHPENFALLGAWAAMSAGVYAVLRRRKFGAGTIAPRHSSPDVDGL